MPNGCIAREVVITSPRMTSHIDSRQSEKDLIVLDAAVQSPSKRVVIPLEH